MKDQPTEKSDTPRELRILEVGDDILFKVAVPEATDYFWTGYKPRGRKKIALGPLSYWRSLRKLWRNEYDLLVLHVPLYPPWHPRPILTVLRDWGISAPRGLFAIFAWWLIQRFHRVPIVAIDFKDSFGVGRHAFRLIDISRAYFKRELPADRWQVFYKTGHANLPGLRWRKKAKGRRRLAKLHPLSYGAPVFLPVPTQNKTTDIFFAGALVHNSTARSDGIAELLSLRSEGYVIDVPERRLDFAEFQRRIAQAWLAWSPGGLGWDCRRHYEIAWLGTVPLMNYPTIVRDYPFRDGEHCILYGVEPGELAQAARNALADRPRLARMGAAAAEHCRLYHTTRARAERVAVVAIGRKLDGCAVSATKQHPLSRIDAGTGSPAIASAAN